MVELLAPAGNFEKLKLVFYYGADAVYFGGKDYSLRSFADNFTEDETAEAIEYAKKIGKKAYITLNIFPRNGDFDGIKERLKFLEKMKADGVIITDAGVLTLAKEVAPSVPIHLSTQANTLNKYSARFFADAGVKRIIPARELSLAELKEIKDYNKDIETEAFIHGAMCVSYSGRCLLSNYFTGRDANRGECVQACRWRYRLTEEKGREIDIEEDGRGVYLFNSKDLKLIEHIGGLISAGVTSFKIEGRMKSEYYLASTINAYRRAIDEYIKYSNITNISLYNEELAAVSNRHYTTAYMLGDNAETISYEDEQLRGASPFAAIVLSYADGVAEVEMRNRFRAGDVLEVLSPSDSFRKTFTVPVMYNGQGDAVTDAKLVQERLRMSVPYRLEKYDILRR